MDFVRGILLEKSWAGISQEQRESAATKVADLMNRMQSINLNDLAPGPVGYDMEADEPWPRPYFTDYGTGPFPTLGDMEDWYNHKLDVCVHWKQGSDSVPRFEFKDLVTTHQDIVPRNIIVKEETGEVWLIDWGMGGIYPVGFEQAALAWQGPGEYDRELRELVLPKLAYQGDLELRQLRNILYGVTTAAFL
ncbi:hypothetical protein CORC01_05357 [Colletotrichum orchidophilum]|uniref:Aminoglycoside phosphotransferase domain-containing protein n=1 Tax=Colletotrichum orchidophilum TaxID=1209926 RepID=A0A1G4BDB1_9PEZI|nr:uncharacterized protein CORC01_05357 [Colletotrichum orchidophilum]OHE99316.1 hypothetical protein CORC01_05357 [Colletotrichum orchidophilum]